MVVHCVRSHTKTLHSYVGIKIFGEELQKRPLCGACAFIYLKTPAVNTELRLVFSHLKDRHIEFTCTTDKVWWKHFLIRIITELKTMFFLLFEQIKKIIWSLTELRLGPLSSYRNQFSRFITFFYILMIWCGIVMYRLIFSIKTHMS